RLGRGGQDGRPTCFNDRGQFAVFIPFTDGTNGVFVVQAPFAGDMNCDNDINPLDVAPFVQAVLDPSAYRAAFPLCDIRNGDVNGDGLIDGDDIGPFIARLMNGL